MESSTLLLVMTCDELREEFGKCPDDINKRMLIIDVRNSALYNRSHLCLDRRNNINSIKTKMRVMNIDPDRLKVCTVKTIMSILNDDDLNIFSKRRDATEVIIIDKDTDSVTELYDPKSKVMRLAKSLRSLDHQPDKKIIVPIHVLKGGFREWLLKYPHFTTDPTFDPDTALDDIKQPGPVSYQSPSYNSSNSFSENIYDCPSTPSSSSSTSPYTSPIKPLALTPLAPRPYNTDPPQPLRPLINKPVPPTPSRIDTQTNKITPPVPSAQKPTIIKNAPGTAVPVTPGLILRPALPRSHSSPNVAQTEGDSIEEPLSQFDRLVVTNNTDHPNYINNNHIVPSAPAIAKPKFDRTLKPPAFNNDAVNAIRAQLNFGRSPEASGKAITGLQNLGNTCFMNSVIQCLTYAPNLVGYFCSDSYYNHINFNSQYGTKGELAIEFGSLVERLSAHRHRYIEPKSFRESVVKHIGFAGNEQQDSHEFMMMLFDKMHHDLNLHAKDKVIKQNGIAPTNSQDDSNINIPRATLGYQFWKKHLELNKSIISDLFEGIFMSTLTCTYCKGQSNTFEVFNCLSLPIPSQTRCHVRECLSHFSNPERIDAAWECPRCKQKREADKKIVICKLPKILIIHLKRFSLDGRWRQKLQTTVDFPLKDLCVDCTNVLPQSAYGSTPPKNTYNLYAVVNHYGHLDGGHYTAFCKLDNQRWYKFDDSNVFEMQDTDVCGQAAYILFYGST